MNKLDSDEYIVAYDGYAPSPYPGASGFCNRGGHQLFFEVMSDISDRASVRRMESPLIAWRSDRCGNNRLWRVNTNIRGVQQTGSGDIDSLSESQIRQTLSQIANGSQVVSDTTEAFNTTVPVRVDVSQIEGLTYSFFADANQPIEVFANVVEVTILGPSTNAFVIRPNETRTIDFDTADGIVADVVAEAVIQRVGTNLAHGVVEYSEWLPVAADTTGRIRVPPRAESVSRVSTSTIRP
jgi:hypothetical protein